MSQVDKCEVLKQLHEGSEVFIIPNPWDAGSARLLQGMGFKALATTSAGFAYAIGRTDGEPTLEEKLAHCREIVAATDLPVNADFENAFADSPEGVAANVTALVDTGVAGLSVEDFSRDSKSIYDVGLAVERVAAARQAIDDSGVPVQLTARAENLLRGINPSTPVGTSALDDTIARLQAFEKAGADVLYAPGVTSLADLGTVTASIGKPFNVLGIMIAGASLADFAAAGAKRVSLGSALTWLSLAPVVNACQEMSEHGTFGWTAGMISGGKVNEIINRQ